MSSEIAYRPVTLTPRALAALADRAERGEVTVWRPAGWADGDPFLRTEGSRVVLSVWIDRPDALLDAAGTLHQGGRPWHDYLTDRGWTGTPPGLLVECECACGCDWAGRFDDGVLGDDLMRCGPCASLHAPLLRTTGTPEAIPDASAVHRSDDVIDGGRTNSCVKDGW